MPPKKKPANNFSTPKSEGKRQAEDEIESPPKLLRSIADELDIAGTTKAENMELKARVAALERQLESSDTANENLLMKNARLEEELLDLGLAYQQAVHWRDTHEKNWRDSCDREKRYQQLVVKIKESFNSFKEMEDLFGDLEMGT